MNQQTFDLLAHKGSLTEKFKQMIGEPPVIKKLHQGVEFVSREERELLDIPARQYALVREIKMGDGQTDWLFARTVVPLYTLAGSAKRIAMLDNEPIGKILFGRQGAMRSFMDIDRVGSLPLSDNEHWNNWYKPLWQRRSMFHFSNGPILLREVFLPECPIYRN